MFNNHEYLIEVKTNVYHIPERLKEYDNNLFVVFNARKNTFEVHSKENKGSTYVMTVPFSELDDRIIHHVKKHDLKMQGNKMIEEMNKTNERLELQQEKDRKNWIKDVVKETRWHFKKACEE